MTLRFAFPILVALLLETRISSATTNVTDPKLLAYNLRTTVEAYDRAGRKDPNWDAPARDCLAQYAEIRSATNDVGNAETANLKKNVSALIDLKCDDPMIRYLYVRYLFMDTHEAAENAKAYAEAGDALQTAHYPASRAFSAYMRAATELKRAKAAISDIAVMRNRAVSALASALAEDSLPGKEADQMCDFVFAADEWSDPGRWEIYQKLRPMLEKHWNETGLERLMKGRAYLSYAWTARGSGWASTVSDANWKIMNERLDVAANTLTRAWELDPHDSRICLEMVRVELGQGKGRDTMELWFNRGMKLDPANFDICEEKLEYLSARWFGSDDAMIKFGKECAGNTNWRGKVPLILGEAHYKICSDLDREAQAEYWRQPKVWNDIEMCYGRFLERNPQDAAYRQSYARLAYLSEQWQVFLDQTKLFPRTNYTYFGGKVKFDAMVKTAIEEVRKK